MRNGIIRNDKDEFCINVFYLICKMYYEKELLKEEKIKKLDAPWLLDKEIEKNKYDYENITIISAGYTNDNVPYVYCEYYHVKGYFYWAFEKQNNYYFYILRFLCDKRNKNETHEHYLARKIKGIECPKSIRIYGLCMDDKKYIDFCLNFIILPIILKKHNNFGYDDKFMRTTERGMALEVDKNCSINTAYALLKQKCETYVNEINNKIKTSNIKYKLSEILNVSIIFNSENMEIICSCRYKYMVDLSAEEIVQLLIDNHMIPNHIKELVIKDLPC